MTPRQRLEEGLATVGVAATETALGRLEAWLALHAQWSRKMNLTGTQDPVELIERHLVDCAAIVPLLPAGALADVGSGAGLPGLVVASLEPERPMYLLEPLERRAAFLRQAALKLGLEAVQVVTERCESWQPPTALAGVLARAVAPLARLVELCAPLLNRGVPLLAMKGPGWREEVGALVAGVRVVELGRYRLPGRDHEHVVLSIEAEEVA